METYISKASNRRGSPSKSPNSSELSGQDRGNEAKCPKCHKNWDAVEGTSLECSVCNCWYHLTCTDLVEPPPDEEPWTCEACQQAVQPSAPPESFKCYLCNRRAKPTERLQCSVCRSVSHPRCEGLEQRQIEAIRKGEDYFSCRECLNFYNTLALPIFHDLYTEPPRIRKNNANSRMESALADADMFVANKPSKLRIISANINGLRGKKDALEATVETYNPDIVLLQETKIDATIKSDELSIPGYVLFRSDRTSGGGGVCVYAKQQLKPRAHRSIQSPFFELASVTVDTSTTRAVFASVYRRPNQVLEAKTSFLDSLEDLIIDCATRPVIAAGDVNIDWLATESDELREMLKTHGMRQLYERPTHGHKAIDHAYVPASLKSVNMQQLAGLEKIHDTLYFETDIRLKRHRPDPILINDFKNANWSALMRYLVDLNLSQGICEAATLDDACSLLQDRILEAMSKFVPTKKVRPKNSVQWVTEEVKRFSRAKDLAHQRSKENPTTENIAACRRLKRKFKQLVRKTKTNFCQTAIEKATTPQEFWKTIRRLQGKTTIAPLPDLQTGGKAATTDQEKADVLTETFESVISMVVLKKASQVLSDPIATLITRCLAETTFPTLWKNAVTVPIPKKENSVDPNDYRPIALLPIISKIAESFILSLIYPAIESTTNDNQFGFRKHRSTTDALLRFDHLVASGFDKCKRSGKATRVAAVFFNIRKAFDSVPIQQLIANLKSRSIDHSHIKLLDSYLRDRTFQVRVGTSISEKRQATSGVPQGSVLGPILFNSYVDQVLETRLSEDANLIMYADDLAYVKPILGPEDEKAVQEDIDKLSESYKSLQLRLNANKCKLMVMSLAKAHQKTPLRITLDQEEIENVENIRYLGVDLDPKLSFKNHVQRIATKTKQAIGALSRTVHKWAPIGTFEKLYKTTVEPIMLYCVEAWYPNQHSLQDRLERVQRMAARQIHRDYRQPYASLLEATGWKPLSRVAVERRIKLAYQYHHGLRLLPEGTIVRQSAIPIRRSIRTTASHEFYMPYAMDNPISELRRNWNAVPPEVASLPSVNALKSSLEDGMVYTHLVNRGIVRRTDNIQ
uniref:Reverse transcriptase n=1 Tax=Acrobeloides nanus TaxID=290746 RepID=A0A914BXJ0_9BILA